MGRKRMPGLTKRSGIWHINKIVNLRRIYESPGASELEEAAKLKWDQIDLKAKTLKIPDAKNRLDHVLPVKILE